MEIEIDFSTDSDLTRLKEIILFIAQECEGDPRFGAVKLNKILYYSDFRAYRETGESITGATYQHLPEGPAPRELLAARDELSNQGAITDDYRVYFGRIQKRIACARPPDLSHFSCDQVRIVRETIQELWPYNAKEVSDLSHLEWGYKLTDEGETIEYRSAWLSPDPLTQEQIQAGAKLWKGISGRAA